MSLNLRNYYPFYWVWMEYLLEKILKIFVSLQGRSIVVRVFYFFIESKPIRTFVIKLILESCLITAFKLKRMLMNKEIEKHNTSSPYIHLSPIPILREILRSQVRSTSHNIKQPLLPFQKLTKRKIIKVRLIFFNSYFFRSNIPINKLMRMQFLQYLHHPCKKFQSLVQLQNMTISTIGQFKQIRFYILTHKIFRVLLLELLLKSNNMRAICQLFSDLEGVLIGCIDLIELLHEKGLAIFSSPIICAIIGSIDYMLLLISSYNHQKILYQNIKLSAFLSGHPGSKISQGIRPICRIIKLLFNSQRSYYRDSYSNPPSSCSASLLGLSLPRVGGYQEELRFIRVCPSFGTIMSVLTPLELIRNERKSSFQTLH